MGLASLAAAHDNNDRVPTDALDPESLQPLLNTPSTNQNQIQLKDTFCVGNLGLTQKTGGPRGRRGCVAGNGGYSKGNDCGNFLFGLNDKKEAVLITLSYPEGRNQKGLRYCFLDQRQNNALTCPFKAPHEARMTLVGGRLLATLEGASEWDVSYGTGSDARIVPLQDGAYNIVCDSLLLQPGQVLNLGYTPGGSGGEQV
ncbi:MAG: hypothetical protein M1829_004116 [Trizodia sp. TS-e1964]|nr:MAG: hypothetical protein M1829_004116 [Trizodia sp. TS-e1964]